MSGTALRWFQLRWPREVVADQVVVVMRLFATTAGTPMVIEAIATPGTVTHQLGLPAGHADNVAAQLRSAIEGLRVDELVARPTRKIDRAIELRLTTKLRPLRTDDPAAASRAVLTALADLQAGESLTLAWMLGRPLRPFAVPNHLAAVPGESWLKDLAMAALGKSIPVDADVRNALRDKQSEPGWRTAGRIGVTAGTASRQRQLIRQVLAALRATEAPGVAFWVRSTNPAALGAARIPWRFPLRINAPELAVLAAWPASATALLPVHRQRTRLLRPAAAIPTVGRVVGDATFPGAERPLAISPVDSLRHTYAIGPSGVGKSTLLSRLIAADIAAGRAVVVIEPKSDLISEVLAHIPRARLDDVVLVDPKDPYGTVGINPLVRDRQQPELVADRLLSIFKHLYGPSFGNRTTDIAAAAFHTLARVPDMSLAALPLILSDATFRRRVLAHIDDPIALEPFWAAFEHWSDAARTEAVAPLLNKVRPFLLRPQLRAVLGQSRPRFDINDVFTKRRILLVDCAKGELGQETAALLASCVIAMVWGATLTRTAIAPERRHPVSVYLDEFQDYLRLPTDLSDALAQARGLGVGFTLANQYLHQLDPTIRSAVVANVQNKICFRLADEDARVFATRGSGLEPDDFAQLEAYEFYAQLVAGGTVQPWCSGRSLPSDPPISDPAVVRAASRANYARPRADVETDIRALAATRSATDDDLTPRRRDGGTR